MESKNFIFILALLHLGEFLVCGWLIRLYELAMSPINLEQKVMVVKLSTGWVHLRIFAAEDHVIGSLLSVLLIRKNFYIFTDYFGLLTSFENVYHAHILKNYLT